MSNENFSYENPIRILNEELGQIIKKESPNYKLKDDKYYTFKHIIYNKEVNNNYEYQVIRDCVCDGTLAFIYHRMCDILEELKNMTTGYTETVPDDKSMIKEVHYEIGDFRIKTEYGDFGTKEKPWLHSRFTVYLPVRCKYILKENENDVAKINIIEIDKLN